MADQSDALRLSAEIVDKFSPVLRDMQRSLRALSATTKTAHQDSIKHAKEHTATLNELGRSLKETGEKARTIFTPALTAIGVGAFGAAEGLRKIVEAIKDFGDSSQALTFLSRQTGLTINQLRIWQELAPRIGTSAESISRGFQTFAEQMEKLRRLGPNLGVIQELHQLTQSMNVNALHGGAGALRQLVQSLQGLNREQQLEKVLKFVDTIQDMGQRRAALQAFGLDPALANKNSAAILKDFEEVHKALRDLSKEAVDKGLKAEQAFHELRTAIHGLSEEIGVSLAPALTEIIKSFSTLISENKTQIAELFKGIGDAIKEFDWKGFAKDVGEITHTFAEWARALEKVAGFLNKMVNPFGPSVIPHVVPGTRKFDVPLPGGRLEDMPGLTDEQRRNLRTLPPGWRTRPQLQLPEIEVKPENQSYRAPGPGGARLMPASYTTAGPNPLLEGGGRPSAGAELTAVKVVHDGVLSALQDFAHGRGGGGAAGQGMAAIKANYSGGGTGLGGAGGGTGEPSASGGAGGAGGFHGGALPRLGDLPGAPAGGTVGTTREFHPPTIPPGAGGMVADRLKAAGVNLPEALEAKIRSGGQVTEQDLKSLPPAELEKANRAVTGAGQAPLFSDKPGGAGGGAGTGGSSAGSYTDFLKRQEGWTSKAQWDQKQWSIGYGTKSRQGEVIDRAEGERRLQAEVAQSSAAVDKMNPNLDPGTRDALTDLHYNAGQGALNDIGGMIRSGDTAGIKQKLATGFYAKAGGQPNAGLARRRLETSSWVGDPNYRKGAAAPGGGGAGGPSRDQAGHQYYEHGNVTLGGQNFHWGSGGAGAGAIPYGSYPININKGDIGPIGQRIGSVATLGGPSGTFTGGGHHWAGVQIHRAFSDQLDHLYTQGCFSVSASEWPAFKQKLLEENAKTPGGLALNVGPNGMASVTARGNANQNVLPAHAVDPNSSKRSAGLRSPASRQIAWPKPNVGASHPNFGHRGATDEARGAMHGPALQTFRSGWGNAAFRARSAKHGEGFAGGGDLLGDARHAGLVGSPMKHEVSGNAHLKIDVNGPHGTQAKVARMDGMFRSIQLNRGRAAAPASQTG